MIGVIVFSSRSMRSLHRCLKSIAWADAIVVLHVGEGKSSLQNDSLLFAGVERAFSIEQVQQRFKERKADWILHLWGEERLDETLQDQIISLCRKESAGASKAYRLQIRSRILNRWVKGSLWGPSPAPRLSAEVQDLRQGWWAGGNAGGSLPLLQGCVEDYSVEPLGHGLEQMNEISTLWADWLAQKGLRLGQVAIILDSFRVGLRLLKMNGMVAKGLAGVTFSILAGYAVLLGGAKHWEIQVQGPKLGENP